MLDVMRGIGNGTALTWMWPAECKNPWQNMFRYLKALIIKEIEIGEVNELSVNEDAPIIQGPRSLSSNQPFSDCGWKSWASSLKGDAIERGEESA